MSITKASMAGVSIAQPLRQQVLIDRTAPEVQPVEWVSASNRIRGQSRDNVDLRLMRPGISFGPRTLWLKPWLGSTGFVVEVQGPMTNERQTTWLPRAIELTALAGTPQGPAGAVLRSEAVVRALDWARNMDEARVADGGTFVPTSAAGRGVTTWTVEGLRSC